MTVIPGLPSIAETTEEPAVPTAVLQPRILWPALARTGQLPGGWTHTDLAHFPDQMLVNERYKRLEGECHSPIFRASVRSAVTRVLIVDNYLLNGAKALAEVLSWFPDSFEAPLVRIACAGVGRHLTTKVVDTAFTEARKAINAVQAQTGKEATRIDLKLDLDPQATPFVHDRFAVVDDELWHFGSTVGGMHPSLNAISRGWPADATKAVEVLGQVWKQRARGNPHGGQWR